MFHAKLLDGDIAFVQSGSRLWLRAFTKIACVPKFHGKFIIFQNVCGKLSIKLFQIVHNILHNILEKLHNIPKIILSDFDSNSKHFQQLIKQLSWPRDYPRRIIYKHLGNN